jgi:hypothetical protein
LPLVGCCEQPAHCLLGILADALAIEVQAAEMVLGIGIAEIGRRIIQDFVGAGGVGGDVVRDARTGRAVIKTRGANQEKKQTLIETGG